MWPQASTIGGMEKKPQDTESRHADKYVVRLPDGMRDRIREASEANGRSMNAEIVARLQASFDGNGNTEEVRNLKSALTSKDLQNRMLYALLQSASEELGDTPLGRAFRRIVSFGDEMDRRFEDDDLSGAMELFLSHYAKIKIGEEP